MNTHRIPDGCGLTAITVGMGTATSGFTATGRIPRMNTLSGSPITGSTATAAGFWSKVTGNSSRFAKEKRGARPAFLFSYRELNFVFPPVARHWISMMSDAAAAAFSACSITFSAMA